MEDYLQNMKNLRSQMNDFEDQATNVSVEEQKQKTAIQTTERDLQLAKSETERLQAEIEQLSRENGKISCQILEKQKMIANLEAESFSLSQNLELLQQEIGSASLKLEEKRAYHSKVTEDMDTKLHEWQEWYNSCNLKKELGCVKGRVGGPSMEITGMTDWNLIVDELNSSYYLLPGIENCHSTPDCLGALHDWDIPLVHGLAQAAWEEIRPDILFENINSNMRSSIGSFEVLEAEENKKYDDLMIQLESAKSKLEELTKKNSTIMSEHCKAKQVMEQLLLKLDDFPPELKGMEVAALEEEQKALLSDKAQEMEYLQSLQNRIAQLKGISHVVKCDCGEEYKIELTI